MAPVPHANDFKLADPGAASGDLPDSGGEHNESGDLWSDSDGDAHFQDAADDVVALRPLDVYPLQIWAMMRQEAEYNTVLREPLCACMNRDPTVPLPPSSALCERGAVQAKLMKVFNKSVQSTLLLLMLSFSPMVSKTLAVLHCTAVGDTYVVVQSMNTVCYNAEWTLYAILAICVGALFLVGVPWLFFQLVSHHRHYRVGEYTKLLRFPKRRAAQGVRGWCRCRHCNAGALVALWPCLACSRSLARVATRVFTEASVTVSSADLETLQVDQRKWKALVELEGRNALLAAKKDCAILSLIPPDDPGTAVREFLYRENLRSVHAAQRVGFMYFAYDHRYWFYELVDMFRRVSLAPVAVFVDNGTAQLVVGMAFAFIAVCIHQTWKPYRYFTDMVVQNVLLVQVFVTMFGATMAQLHRPDGGDAAVVASSGSSDVIDDVVGNGILYSCIAVMLVATACLAREYRLDAADNKRKKRMSEQTELEFLRHQRQAVALVQMGAGQM